MATIENFILRVKTEGAGAIESLSGSISRLGSNMGVAGDAITGITSKLGPLGLAAGAVATAFGGLFVKAVQVASQFADISGATGIAASTLQSFKQSVIDAGGSASDFETIAVKLNQTLNEAAAGNETLQKAFENLGVYVRDAEGKIRPTEEVLQDILSRLRSGTLSAEEYSAAIDLLGKTASRLDLSKLQAINDPFVDAEIAQLDKYGEAWDKLMARLESKLISYAAKVADFLDLNRRLMSDAELAQQGLKRNPQTFFKGEEIVPMSAQEKAAYEANIAEMQRLKKRADAARAEATGKKGGDYGGKSKAQVEKDAKDQADLELRIYKSALEQRTSILLQSAKTEEEQIELRYEKEVAWAEASIKNELERAAKIAEINAAKDLAIVEHRKLTEKKAQAELDSEQKRLAAEAKRIEEIIRASKARISEEEAINAVMAKRISFAAQNSAATDREIAQRQEVFDLEESRLENIRRIQQIKDLPPAELALREQEINNIYKERLQLIEEQHKLDNERMNSFQQGWTKAFRQYREDAFNNFNAAGRLFDKITSGMEDAIVNFAKTGKFEFKSFLNSVLEELLRSQVRQVMAQIFQLPTSSGSTTGGSLFGAIGNLLGFANGGIVPTNEPVIVGERGPELLVGASGRQVIPNSQLGTSTNVTYNINAVDARSFKELVASDPSFIHAVAMQGARSIPGRR